MYSGKKMGKKHFFLRWFDEFSVLRHGNDGDREMEFESRLASHTVAKVWKAIRCCCCFLALQNHPTCNCDDDGSYAVVNGMSRRLRSLSPPTRSQILGFGLYI